MFFQREKVEVLTVTSQLLLVMTLKQAIPRAGSMTIPRIFGKRQARRIVPRTAD